MSAGRTQARLAFLLLGVLCSLPTLVLAIGSRARAEDPPAASPLDLSALPEQGWSIAVAPLDSVCDPVRLCLPDGTLCGIASVGSDGRAFLVVDPRHANVAMVEFGDEEGR